MTHAEVEADLALSLARTLAAATAEAARAPTGLVSITCNLIARPEPGEPMAATAQITRATKSLVFAEADLKGAAARLLMTASAVYRVEA